MKLLYLYVRNYGILKDIEFNFDSKDRFHFDMEKRVLSQIEAENPLPDDFFSISEDKKGDERVVESISAIIGDNGAGKTSVANFLYEHSLSPDLEHIIIWKSAGHYFYSFLIIPEVLRIDEMDEILKHISAFKKRMSGYSGKKLSNNEIAENEKEYKDTIESYYSSDNKGRGRDKYARFLKESEYPSITQNLKVTLVPHDIESFTFIYSSNFYTPMHRISSCNETIDLSTSYLLRKNDYEKHYNGNALKGSALSVEDGVIGGDRVTAHNIEDIRRNVKFFAKYNSMINKIPKYMRWTIPMPLGAIVSLNSNDFKYLRKSLTETKNEKGGNIVSTKECEFRHNLLEIVKMLEAKEDDFITMAMCCFIGNYFRYFIDSKGDNKYLFDVYSAAVNKLNKNLKCKRDSITNNFLKFFEDIVDGSKKERANSTYTCFENVIVLFKILQNNENRYEAINFLGNVSAIIFDIQSNKDNFLEFVDLYFKTNTTTHYLNFDWDPHISSGEYAQLNIYSRLFSLLNKNNLNDLIVFFDEIEITVHPSIQVSLVSNLIKFFEIFFDKCKVHLIFASHSPVLLSDIPKSNVCFIKRDEKMHTVEIKEQPDINNTFGANIHTLYRYSYFMENGTVGELARCKINGCIKAIEKAPQDIEEKKKIKSLISIIGEPVLRNKLYEMLWAKTGDVEEKIEFYKSKILELQKQK